MIITDGCEPFEHGECVDWKPLFKKEGNVAGAATEDFIERMLKHHKIIEAFGNEVNNKFVAYYTPEFYQEFVKRIAKLERIEQVKKERIVKAKPAYTALLGRWAK